MLFLTNQERITLRRFKSSTTLRARSSALSLCLLLLTFFYLLALCGCSTVQQAGTLPATPIPANLTATPPMLRCLRLNPCSAVSTDGQTITTPAASRSSIPQT